VDQGISGSKESRSELNRLMADAHRRKFDAVLCWKIDRFGRSLKHLVNALADLDSYKVLEHYSHVRQEAKRRAVESLDNVAITSQSAKWERKANRRATRKASKQAD
jgi:DNA invertase Pin-like site-specific DNA recombinase